MTKQIWGISTAMTVFAPLMNVVAFAESSGGGSFVTPGGTIFSLVVGAGAAGGWLGLLWARSHTRKIAKNADSYVKKENGGNSAITNKRDAFIRTETETRNRNK